MKAELKIQPGMVYRDAYSHTHIAATVGHKWITSVICGFPIQLSKLPVNDPGLLPLTLDEKPYPLRRALRHFRSFIKDHGITEGARKALDELSRRALKEKP